MKTHFRFWTILAVGLIILSSFSIANKPTGKFKYYWWDGRHGHTRLLRLTAKKYTHKSWSNNFFLPTEIKISGDVSIESDSIRLRPKSIEFYRRQNGSGTPKYKKIKCECDDEGLKIIDHEHEGYIIELCDQQDTYYFHLDTLIEKSTNGKYIRQ